MPRGRGFGGAAHCGVEEQAFLIADVDQDGLLIGEAVDGGNHVVEVSGAGVAQYVLHRCGLPAVADLPGPGDVPDPRRESQDRPAQKGQADFEGHVTTVEDVGG